MFLFFEALQSHNVLILFLFSNKTSYPLMVKNTPNEIIIVYCELSLTFISVPVKVLWFSRILKLYAKKLNQFHHNSCVIYTEFMMFLTLTFLKVH